MWQCFSISCKRIEGIGVWEKQVQDAGEIGKNMIEGSCVGCRLFDRAHDSVLARTKCWCRHPMWGFRKERGLVSRKGRIMVGWVSVPKGMLTQICGDCRLWEEKTR